MLPSGNVRSTMPFSTTAHEPNFLNKIKVPVQIYNQYICSGTFMKNL